MIPHIQNPILFNNCLYGNGYSKAKLHQTQSVSHQVWSHNKNIFNIDELQIQM